MSPNSQGIDTIQLIANYETFKKMAVKLGLTIEEMPKSNKLYEKIDDEVKADSKRRLEVDKFTPIIEVIRLPKVEPKDKSLYISIVRNSPTLFNIATHHKKAKDSFCMVTFAGLHQPTKNISSEAMKIISKFLKRKTFKLYRYDIAIDTKDNKPINSERREEFKGDLSPFSKHGVKLEKTSLYINKIDHETISRINYYDKFQKQQYNQGKEKIGKDLKDWKRFEVTLTFDVTKRENRGFFHYMESLNLINDLETIDDMAKRAGINSYRDDYLIYQLNSFKDNRFLNNHESQKQFNSLEALERFNRSDSKRFRLDLL
jgi:hypothetical protein